MSAARILVLLIIISTVITMIVVIIIVMRVYVPVLWRDAAPGGLEWCGGGGWIGRLRGEVAVTPHDGQRGAPFLD